MDVVALVGLQLTVVEDVICAGGRPRWIAYRVIFGTGETLHLDVTPRGDYDTGTFAYYFIRRGERHGLRIVGSLKSQPALNLLSGIPEVLLVTRR
jgi:hypothetical protein